MAWKGNITTSHGFVRWNSDLEKWEIWKDDPKEHKIKTILNANGITISPEPVQGRSKRIL